LSILGSLLTSVPVECEWCSFRRRPLRVPGVNPPIPLNRNLGGRQNRSGHFGEGIILLTARKIALWFLGRPARRLVAIPTEPVPAASLVIQHVTCQ